MDEGASLLMAFRGLQAEAAAQGEAHKNVAKELQTLVAEPFEEWARGHKVRWVCRVRWSPACSLASIGTYCRQ